MRARAREYYRLAHHKWFALSAIITQTTTRFSSVCVCIYGVWWLLPTAHTHSTKAAGAHPHRHEKFLFWMDGWISRSAFSLFFFVPSSSGDMMNPSLCETGLSFIHHLSVITTHLYYRSSLLSSLREEWAHLVLYTYTSSHINVGRCMKRRIY
jgi:hypothetical protein